MEAAALIHETATTGRGYRVLVVEDNDDVGRFSTELLEDLGYVVRRVADAKCGAGNPCPRTSSPSTSSSPTSSCPA